ncbi:MAG: ROK family protein [Thermoplasmata archaeon]|nr:ROK family protein [Thermoplasmata archaeon]
MKRTVALNPRRIMVLDVGGSHVRVAITGVPKEIRIPSGPSMDPARMMRKVKKRVRGRKFDVVTIGYPGLVVHGRIVGEPHNLATGWVGYDFEREFRRPTRIINDAAMQALGSYRGGNMLFLGLGTGLGSAMIFGGELEPMELAHLVYKKDRTYEEVVGNLGRLRLGRKRWEKEVFNVVKILSEALEPDYVMLGGGNVRRIKELPPGVRRGDNHNAILGGIRLWAPKSDRGTAPTNATKPPRRRRKSRPARRAPRRTTP